MRTPDPALTTHLFPGLLKNLVGVLDSLTSEEWDLPTPCPGWSVHDLAAHILGDEIGQLSMGRDRFQPALFTASNWDELVVGLNDLNERWVEGMRGVSSRLITDLSRRVDSWEEECLRLRDELGVVPGFRGFDQ